MPLERFIPKSPDPFIRNSQDFEVAKFGHLNTIIEYVNTYVVTDSLQLSGTGPLSATARYITDSLGTNSSLAISTGNIGIGTTNPIFKLSVNSGISGVASFIGNSLPTNFKSEISIGDIANSRGFSIGIDPFETGNNVLYFFSTETAHLPVAIKSQTLIIGNYDVSLPAGMDTATGLYMRVVRQAIFRTSGGLPILKLATDGTTQLGNETPMNARLGIKGSGSTSATTSLLVQNSGGTETFRVYDSGSVSVGLGLTVGSGQSVSDGTFALFNNRLETYNAFSIQTIPENRLVNLSPASTNVLSANYYLGGNQIGVVVYDSGSYSHSSSAVLQVNSTTRGFLPPKMTTTQRTAIVSPAAGLIVYDTTTNKSYTYDGTAWQAHW